MFTIRIILLLLGLGGLFAWVANTPQTVGKQAVEVSFRQHIAPLMETKCAIESCHRGEQPPDLQDYRKIKTWVGRIRFRVNYLKDPMPPLSAAVQLTDQERALINEWILQGSKDN